MTVRRATRFARLELEGLATAPVRDQRAQQPPNVHGGTQTHTVSGLNPRCSQSYR